MIKIYPLKKTLFFLTFSFCGLFVAAQNTGWNTSYAVFSLNGGGDTYFCMPNNGGCGGNTPLDGASLGTFAANSNNLILKGAQHNVYKCNGADITSTRINYRIYTGAPGGGFTVLNIGFFSGSNNGCGGQDQQWQDLSKNVNVLSGLSAGSYTIEIYSDESTTDGTIYLSNGGANYKATFTVADQFYSKSTGNLDVVSNWGTGTDGSGTPPVDFTPAGITYNIRNRATATIGSAWTVSGAGSKVVVGDGTNPCNFTIPSGAALSGTVDISANATLTIQNTSLPTLGTINASSTIDYDVSGAQNVTARTDYGNLTLSGSGAKTMLGNVSLSGTLTVSSGNTLSIGSNILTINGPISGSGTLTGSPTSNMVIGGTALGQTLNFTPTSAATRSLNNLTVNNLATATLSSSLNIYGALSLSGVSTLDLNNQSVTLKSTSSGTARVGNLTTSFLNNASSVTVERYISSGLPNRAWRLLSIPVASGSQTINAAWQNGQAAGTAGPGGLGTWITSNNGNASFDAQTNGPSMLTYNSTTDTYQSVANTTSAIATDQGYMLYVRGDRTATNANPTVNSTTLSTTGTLKQGPYPLTPFAVGADKFEIIGNPYASEIDLTQIVITGGVQDVFYIWDPKLTTHSYGGFQTFTRNGATYDVTPGGGSYPSQTKNIQSGQAFFTHAVATAGTISFVENSKSTGTSNIGYKNTFVTEQLKSNLYAFDAGTPYLIDGTLAQYNKAYSNNIDRDDALKLVNFAENISMARNNKLFVVERRQVIASDDTVFFNINNLKQQSYRLEFVASAMDHLGLSAFLQDSYQPGIKTPVNLNGSTVVDFVVNADAASAAANRFRIVFAAAPSPIGFSTVKAYPQGANIAVEWAVDNELNMQQYTVEHSADGINFSSLATIAAKGNTGTKTSYNSLDLDPYLGENFYRIKAVSLSGKNEYSAVVNVKMDRILTGISIYPNPVAGGAFSMLFHGMEKGIYQLRILNTMGQLVLTQSVTHNGINEIKVIDLNKNLVGGNYRVEIIKPDNGKVVTALVIL